MQPNDFLLDRIIKVGKIKGLPHQVAKIWELENLSSFLANNPIKNLNLAPAPNFSSDLNIMFQSFIFSFLLPLLPLPLPLFFFYLLLSSFNSPLIPEKENI